MSGRWVGVCLLLVAACQASRTGAAERRVLVLCRNDFTTGLILGIKLDHRWVSAEQALPQLVRRPARKFFLFGGQRALGVATAVRYAAGMMSTGALVFFRRPPEGASGPTVIGLSRRPLQPFPRPTTCSRQETGALGERVRRFVEGQGWSLAVGRVCEADLDGDGTVEALLEMTDARPPAGRRGWGASAVLLATRGGVSLLEGSFPAGAARRARHHAVAHVLDLDEDGKLEVVTYALEEGVLAPGEGKRVTGAEASVYAWEGSTLRRVLLSGDRVLTLPPAPP